MRPYVSSVLTHRQIKILNTNKKRGQIHLNLSFCVYNLWKKYALYDKVRTFLFKIIYLFIKFVNWKLKICLFWLWFFLFFLCFSKKKYALFHKVRTFIRNQKRKGKSHPVRNHKSDKLRQKGRSPLAIHRSGVLRQRAALSLGEIRNEAKLRQRAALSPGEFRNEAKLRQQGSASPLREKSRKSEQKHFFMI